MLCVINDPYSNRKSQDDKTIFFSDVVPELYSRYNDIILLVLFEFYNHEFT